MCLALRRADGFALYFALVNLPSARRAIACQVIEQVDLPVIELDVPAEGFGDTTLDGWLLPQLEELDSVTPETALFLHGLDRVMPTGHAALCHFLQLLNWRRGALASVGRPLVIWLPRYALDKMAEYAPDLYDWYSNVYEFASPQEEAEELRGGFLTEFGTAVHPASRQTKVEKEQWLHTLTSLLDEHPKRNAYRARLLDDAGIVHDALGNLEDALELYKQSLAIRQEIGDRKGEGTALNNISLIYDARGDYDTAQNYLEQSLDIRRETGDRAGEGATLNNLATTAYAKGEYDTALTYLEQSLNIRQEVGDQVGEGGTLNNIGEIHRVRGDYDKALPLYEQALGIFSKTDSKSEVGALLNNISLIYKARGEYDTALTYLEQSLNIRQEVGDRAGETVTSWNIGHTYKKQGDLRKAEQYVIRAVALAEEIGHLSLEKYRKALKELQAEIKGR
jgi:tetratricopeptide (TPR) repeat protein